MVGYFLVGLIWLIAGTHERQKVCSNISHFMAEHGLDAGEQTHVT